MENNDKENVINIVIHRKKQFASFLVPFYIVIDFEKNKLKEIINNYRSELENCKNEEERYKVDANFNRIINGLPIFPIKCNKIIKIKSISNKVNVYAINGNFSDNSIYQFTISNEIIVNEDITLELKQSSSLVSLALSLERIKVDYSKHKYAYGTNYFYYQCFDFVPYQKVGNFIFGQNREKVIQEIGKPLKTIKDGFPNKNRYCDDYEYMHIYSNEKGNVDAINIFPDSLKFRNYFIKCNNIRIKLTLEVEYFVKKLGEMTDDIEKQEENNFFMGYRSKKLGISIYCPNQYIEAITICNKNYYNKEIEK